MLTTNERPGASLSPSHGYGGTSHAHRHIHWPQNGAKRTKIFDTNCTNQHERISTQGAEMLKVSPSSLLPRQAGCPFHRLCFLRLIAAKDFAGLKIKKV
jgi:hypothetical protein